MNNDFSQLYYTEHNIKKSMHGHLSIKYACGKPIPETNSKEKEVLVCIRLEEGGKEMYVCISLFCIKGSPLNGCKGRKEGGINWKIIRSYPKLH